MNVRVKIGRRHKAEGRSVLVISHWHLVLNSTSAPPRENTFHFFLCPKRYEGMSVRVKIGMPIEN
jgi:hypothetical protein